MRFGELGFGELGFGEMGGHLMIFKETTKNTTSELHTRCVEV